MAAAAVGTKRWTGIDGSIAALPDELLVEVFSRVGSAEDLFMFAVTSQRWLRRFTDPAFLRELFPGCLLGLFPRQTEPFLVCSSRMKMRMAQRTSVSAPTFLPAPGSSLRLRPTERALTAFVSDDDGTFNYAEPLTARRGFVLMHLVPRTYDFDQMRSTTGDLLAICNPATGERHVLPPLGSSWSCGVSVKGYAIITTADEGKPPWSSSGRFTAFSQLLLVTTMHGSHHLHSYSAATRSWSAEPARCMDGISFSFVGERPATVHRGAAHWLWLCNDDKTNKTSAPRDDSVLYKLSAEVGAAARVSLTKLPVRVGGTPLLYVSGDGKLSITCVYLVHATVWTQQQDGEEEVWLRTRVFRTPVVVPNPKDPPEVIFEEWFELDRGLILVMYRGGGVFAVDLGKEVIEKVMDCFPLLFSDKHHCSRRCVPYEMDLVELFCLVLALVIVH